MKMKLPILFLVILFFIIPTQAQLTDAQKVAFANMELRGYQDLGIDSHLVERIVHWYQLGNTTAARAMIRTAYEAATGIDVSIPAEVHQLRHWIESYTSGFGKELEQ